MKGWRAGLLEVGPIVRAASRQKSTFALVVLQLASGFLIAGSLVTIGSWFRQMGHASVGYDEASVIGAQVRVPRTPPVATDTGAPAVERGGAAMPGEAIGEALRRLAAAGEVLASTPLFPPLRAEAGAPTLYLAGAREIRAWTIHATPALLDVLQLVVLEGGVAGLARAPGDGDRAPPIVITKQVRDGLFAAGEAAVGQVIVADDSGPGRVVAVVADFMARESFWENAAAVVVRFTAPPEAGEASFLARVRPGRREAVERELRAAAGPASPTRLVSIVAYGAVQPRFQGIGDGLVLVFFDVGLTMVAIALVGAVAVSSFVVAARRREIGIRRAVGASRGDILRYFLVESTLAAALGIGIGLVLTVALLMAMRHVMPGLPIGRWQLATAAALMWVNATAAALLPARHAARISPTLATRGG